MSLANKPRRALAAGAVALAAAFPVFAGAAPDAAPKRIPLNSDWIGTQDGWEWIADGGSVRATRDGGRTWELTFRGGNYLFFHARTSGHAAAVATGRISGLAYWTNDGGRDWFPLGVDVRAVVAGTGNQLYWHDRGDTLYRVEGWPPRGDFTCEEVVDSDFGSPLPGHRLCRTVGDGLRSVVAIRLVGSTFGSDGGMIAVPPARGSAGGIVELVHDLPHPRGGAPGRGVVVVRGGGIALARQLPRPRLEPGEETGGETLFASWPRVYVVAPLFEASAVPGLRSSRIGLVLWHSRDGADRWNELVARSLPRRAAHARGPVRLGARVVLPSGWVAVGRAGGRPVVAVRQLGRTRPLVALPGSSRCGALRAVVDWPHIVVEGRRARMVRAVWLSSDGGYRWTSFGRC